MHRVVALARPRDRPVRARRSWSRSSGSTGRSSTCPGGTSCASPPRRPGRCRRPPAGSAFFVEHGLEALEDRRHDRRARLARRPVTGGRRRGARGARARRAAGLDLQRGLPARRHGPARRRRGGDALALRASSSPTAIPRVTVNADVLYVDAGSVLTSAGSAAGIDLCLHIVRRDHGSSGRQRRRAAAGDPAPPRRRPGAADRACRCPRIPTTIRSPA